MRIHGAKPPREVHAGPEAFEPESRPAARHGAQLAFGAAMIGGALLLAALTARRHEQLIDDQQYAADFAEMHEPVGHPRKALTSLVLPPLFLALTLSGMRVWNAPASPTRTRALTLWGLVQGFNALWLALGPKRLGGQLGAAVASLGVSAAYALSARRIIAPASSLAGPYLGWIGFANALSDELWKRPAKAVTVH